MTQQEYEHKKAECWEKASRRYGISLMNGTIHAAFNFAFNFAFNRAYALGKEKETILQEEIEKDSKEFADRECEIGQVDWDALYKGYYHGMKDSIGKQEKDADTVISGWVAVDEAFNQCFLHTEKPIQKAQPIADTGDYDTVWDSKGKTYLLDTGLFPDMDSDSEPQECEIIIKRKKNGNNSTDNRI